ncbi:DUF4336 domain-containing protein [Myxacorys almedinensis A]|uniref:DUF4336 domain-containing protein n=2 Tax=Myxacorys TaxID=2056239 RepID=A0A8J7Z2T8_9CYAN|nr:DUF4336 domain-containing protein [Myxacorys almedinensis]NDJ17146.1 DUF4336 domain-containing protein [Myxacorys almedinensis A]
MAIQGKVKTFNPASKDWNWLWWFTLPLYPYSQRRTLCTEVVRDTIWTFDQIQGILYVVTPIRMTAVKLDQGGLLIYAPIAPTSECIRLVNELVAEHGEVRYIILPTVSGLEHKVFVAPFARRFPQAQVFVAPHQWSFPFNLPLSWLGFPASRTVVLPQDSRETPFGDQFEYAILGPVALGIGPFEEVAFFHPRSRSLLVTDAVVSIPDEPPAIVQLDPFPLLYHAKDRASDRIEDTPENRRKGWHRISLFAFYFNPSALKIMDLLPSIKTARTALDRSRKNYFGWFPYTWRADWHRSFEALRGEGRLFVAPILQRLILNRIPNDAIAWADRVASWNFERVIPCHFDSPISATPQQFRQAFAFLERQPLCDRALLPEADFGLLNDVDQELSKRGITPPAKEKI